VVDHHAEGQHGPGVKVAAGACFTHAAADHELGRCIPGREHGRGGGVVELADASRGAEIDEDELVIVVEQHVGGFDVAVEESGGVHGGERFEQRQRTGAGECPLRLAPSRVC